MTARPGTKISELRPDQLDAVAADRRRSLCWSCGVVETIPVKAFKVCRRCGHVYPNVIDLVEAYNRYTPDWARRRTLADVAEVMFCQECCSDFA